MFFICPDGSINPKNEKKSQKMGDGANFTPLYLGSGWVDFFRTHIKMTVRT